MPSKYELRCKRIPHKYLNEKGKVYGINWAYVAGGTLDVTYIDYRSSKHTEKSICAVMADFYIFRIKASSGCSSDIAKEIKTLAKYTELWAVYPNYKRRVW